MPSKPSKIWFSMCQFLNFQASATPPKHGLSASAALHFMYQTATFISASETHSSPAKLKSNPASLRLQSSQRPQRHAASTLQVVQLSIGSRVQRLIARTSGPSPEVQGIILCAASEMQDTIRFDIHTSDRRDASNANFDTIISSKSVVSRSGGTVSISIVQPLAASAIR